MTIRSDRRDRPGVVRVLDGGRRPRDGGWHCGAAPPSPDRAQRADPRARRPRRPPRGRGGAAAKKLVVGYAPDWRGRAVLHLAGMLARSAQDDLVVCAVVPSPLPPRPAQVDSEHRRFLDGMAQAALERARERLPGDVAAASQVHHASSAPAGLLEVTERRKAAMIVVGTSGHPAIGSVTARLLHGSPVPVALAPHRFRSGAGARMERVTPRAPGADPRRS